MGIFYNPIEQLVLEQFSAEPPFGGSNFISNPFLQTPFVDQSGDVFPNPFHRDPESAARTTCDWSQFRPMTFFGEFPGEFANAVFGPVQLDDQAAIARGYPSSSRLCGIARPPVAGKL